MDSSSRGFRHQGSEQMDMPNLGKKIKPAGSGGTIPKNLMPKGRGGKGLGVGLGRGRHRSGRRGLSRKLAKKLKF